MVKLVLTANIPVKGSSNIKEENPINENYVGRAEFKSVMSLVFKLNRNYNNLLQMFVNDIAQRNMINRAVGGKDYGSIECESDQSNSRGSKDQAINDMLAKSEKDEKTFEQLYAEANRVNDEKDTNTKSTGKQQGNRVDREQRNQRKRSRSRSRSRSREYRNYMATIELSISSDDLYWKVMIVCVMLGIMFLCEHFISNVFVKIIVTILNTVLLVNFVLGMATDADKDNNAMERLKAINKITKESIHQPVENVEFILPVVDDKDMDEVW